MAFKGEKHLAAAKASAFVKTMADMLVDRKVTLSLTQPSPHPPSPRLWRDKEEGFHVRRLSGKSRAEFTEGQLF